MRRAKNWSGRSPGNASHWHSCQDECEPGTQYHKERNGYLDSLWRIKKKILLGGSTRCVFHWVQEVMKNPHFNTIAQVLGQLIPNGAEVALLDYPNYSNVGDSAIWLGQKSYLDQRPDLRVVFVCPATRRPQRLPNLPEGAVILLQGGGNFGDLWPLHQTFREGVLARYPSNRIIQLPQSIHFLHRKNETRCWNALNRHADFHLVLRDRASLHHAEHAFHGPTYLCPDMALCLGPLPRACPARFPIVGLLRSDKERARGAASIRPDPADFVVRDWVNEKLTVLNCVQKMMNFYSSYLARYVNMSHEKRHDHFDSLAREKLLEGCGILCSGDVVVTDRLHGHILCCLLDIPHVVMDNVYGKIGNFRETWNTGDGLCLTAVSRDDAYGKALALRETFRNR